MRTPSTRVPARRRSLSRPALIGAGLIAAIALGWFGATRIAGARDVLRVAVPAPEITGADSVEAAFVANAAQLAVVRGLSSLRGVGAVDPAEVSDDTGSPLEIARAASADEVVAVTIAAARGEWSVGIRRVSVADGTVRWTDTFSVPQEPALVLTQALVTRLRHGYPQHAPRRADAATDVSSEDFDEYLQIERSFRERGSGATTLPKLAERLDALLQGAPAFLEAQLLAADMARYRFTTEQDGALLARASAAAAAARKLAPEDTRAIASQMRIALVADSLDRARALVDEYHRVAPGDVGIRIYEAALAERSGDVERALSLLREAAERRPSRYYLVQLADFEYRVGRIDDARRNLERLMERYPEYQISRARLAQLELMYGKPERAQSLLMGLTERFPETNSYRTNLGLARMLLGNYAGASADLRIAHERRPKNIAVLLNLADSEGLAGHADSAKALYRRTLSLIEVNPAAGKWDNRLRAAQCLAQIGRTEEALATARTGLAAAPENSEALYMASLVFVLAGRRDSATTLAVRALDKGVNARWFAFPWFDPLESDTAYTRRLATNAPVVAAP